MSELADILWQEFATESDEHLAVLEPLLVRVGTPESAPGDVARLFRGFHSLKGLARAMSLQGMEHTAHRAENLLGLVRDHGVAMNDGMLDALLEAVDCLKSLRESVVDSRVDPPAPAPLLLKLDALFEAAGGGEAKAAAQPKAAAVAAAAPPTEADQEREMLDLFVELLQTRLPELADLFDADDAKRADLIDTLNTLENAAGVMDFDQIAETVRDLCAAVSAEVPPLAPDARRRIATQVARVVMQARLLGEVAGGDTGGDTLTGALSRVLADDRASTLAELDDALEALETAAHDHAAEDVQGVAGTVFAAAQIALAMLQCSGLARAVDLMLLIEDICARIARGELTPSAPAVSAMVATVEAVADRTADGLDLDDERATELARLIRDNLVPDRDASDSAQLKAKLATYDVRPEVLEVLSPENVHALVAGFEAGANVYELLLFLEGAPAVGETLIAWLRTETTVISNRTVLTNGESWFDFLIFSQHPPAAVREALLARDPGRQCVKTLRLVGGETLLDDAGARVPAPNEPEAPRSAEGGAEARGATVLRVRSDVIDRFMTQIGEIRVVAAELAELTGAGAADAEQRQRAITEHVRRVETDLRRLQASALDLRVVPIDTILNRFPRVVRTLAQEQGKDVKLVLEGRDVRVDKSMVELLVDPLMHMVRNAVDHGIERPDDRLRAGKPAQATVTMRAMQRGGEVHVQVIDDGRGLNETAIIAKAISRGMTTEVDAALLKPHEIHRFVFAPGFSTAATVTETSGRGVGMDVVATTVQQLGGNIDVDTRFGFGATFTLRLPLSAALQAALLVRVDNQTFGIVERFVSSVLEVSTEEFLEVAGQAAVSYKGMALPVYALADLLWHGAAGQRRIRKFRSIVVISNGREMIGLEVDRVRRRQELFLKDLHPLLAACPTVSGAAVLADGRIVLLLDADELIRVVRGGAWRGAPAAATGTGP